MKLESFKDIQEYTKRITKLLAEDRLVSYGTFDIQKLLNYEEVEFTNRYKKILLKSTKVGEPQKFTHQEEKQPGNLYEDISDMVHEFDLPEDPAQEFSTSMKEFLLFRNLHITNEYWGNSYKYDETIEEPREDENISLPETELEDISKNLLSIFNIEENFFGNPQFELTLWRDDTGYIVPEYPLLKMQFDYPTIEKVYSDIVDDFILKEENNLSKAVELGNYRDLLVKQINRQISQIDNLNDYIRNFLVSLYKIIESTIFKRHNFDSSKNNIEDLPRDWYFCLQMVKAISDDFYENLTEDSLIEYHCTEIKRNPYLTKDLKTEIAESLQLLYKKKKPIVLIARKIALKLRVTEALLESILTDDNKLNLIDLVDSISYNKLPSPRAISRKFVNREQNKSGKYSADEIEPVMKTTREYIIQNDVENMYRKVRTVANIFKETTESQMSVETLANWIEYYATEAGRYSKQNSADENE